MIDISRNTIFVALPDGRTIPFVADDLRQTIRTCLEVAGVHEKQMASDIAYAIEFSLTCKLKNDAADTIPAAVIDETVIHMLQSIGASAAAEEYRKISVFQNDPEKIPVTRIGFFLQDRFVLPQEDAEAVARKVVNTLSSIGAESATPSLILELSKHFISHGLSSVKKATVDFSPSDAKAPESISKEELSDIPSPAIRSLIHQRILCPQQINLNIFPTLQLHLRLFPLATANQFQAPLTELSVAPALLRLAAAADTMAIHADDCCRARAPEFAAFAPLKIMICFPDILLFVREWMACPDDISARECASGLASSFSASLTRNPIKTLCE